MRGVEREWEELRKDARKLESELDVKLVSFSKVGQGVGEAVLQGERPSEVRAPQPQKLQWRWWEGGRGGGAGECVRERVRVYQAKP